MSPGPALLIPPADPAAATAVAAATQVWLERAVIGLNLCPFAKAVHVKEQIRYAVTGATTADQLLAELDHELRHLAATMAPELDTTLLIHPRVMEHFLDFHFFLAEADALIRNEGFTGVFQIASLHPQYEFAGSGTDDIENYSNRSPYPTLHLLREASIDRAVAAFPTRRRSSSATAQPCAASAMPAGASCGWTTPPRPGRGIFPGRPHDLQR